MKAILSVAVVAAMLGGASTLHAATNSKKKSKKVKKAVAAKTIKKKATKKKSPLSFGVRVENEYAGKDLDQGGLRKGTTYLQLRANYKINSNLSLRVNQELTQAYDDGERTKAAVGNTYVQVAASKLGTIGKAPVKGYVRAILPTSIATREDKNQYLELRGEASVKFFKTKRFSLSAHTHGRYYAAEKFSDVSTITVNNVNMEVQKINADYRLRNYLTGSYSVGKFYFLQQLGVQHDFLKSNEATVIDATSGQSVLNPSGKPHLYAYAETGYQITNNIGLELGVYSLTKMDKVNDLGIYDTQDNLYYLNAAISF